MAAAASVTVLLDPVHESSSLVHATSNACVSPVDLPTARHYASGSPGGLTIVIAPKVSCPTTELSTQAPPL